MQAEICIIGSGVAATALALSEELTGRSVVLLEAGSFRSDPAGGETLQGVTDEADHEGFAQVSPRRVGGAMSVWGGRMAPLDPEDFVARPERSQSWPLDRAELDPWYRRAQDFLRGGAFEYRPTAVLPGAAPFLVPPGAGSQLVEKLWLYSLPLRFGDVKKRVGLSTTIRLVHHALVTELCQDPRNVTTHAVVSTAPGRRFTVAAESFVVAAGGLQSTRLLLASGRGGLGNEHDQVGRNYITHPVADVGRLEVHPAHAARLCAFERTVDGVYARRFLAVHPDVRAEQRLLNINLAVIGPDPHDPSHGDGLLSAYALSKRLLLAGGWTAKTGGVHRFHAGRRLQLSPHLRNIATTAPGTVRQAVAWSGQRWLHDRQVPALLTPGRSGSLRLRFDAEQRPDPDNRVDLLPERDRFGMPRMRLRYRVSAEDRDSYYRSLRIVGEEVRRLGVGVLHLPERETIVEQLALGSGTHQMGLLRMSDAPSDGVVDRHCRVHSSPNTYVLSTAVFPTAGSAPPTLTLAALAMRLAATLAQRTGRGVASVGPVPMS